MYDSNPTIDGIIGAGKKIDEERQGEVLFKDGMKAWGQFYILVNGVIRLEKEVEIERGNLWPVKSDRWESNKIQKNVLFKIQEVKGVLLIGEREFTSNGIYPVTAIAESSQV